MSVSFFLWADCTQNLNITSVLKTNNASVIKGIARQLKQCPNKKNSLADCYHKLGIIYYHYESNIDSAISFTNKALLIRQDLYKDSLGISLGKSYNNLGVFYGKKNLNKLAKTHFKKAIEVYRTLDIPSRLGRCYNDLGIIHLNEGEYELASNLFNYAILEAKEINDDHIFSKALLNLGNIANEKKDFHKAIDYLQKAERILSEYNSIDEAVCYTNLGVAYYRLKDYDKAINYYQKGIKIYEALDICNETAKAFNNLGIVYQKNQQLQKAFNAFQEGIKIAKSCSSSEMIAQSFDHLGEYYLTKKEHQKALAAFQKAILTLIPSFTPENDLQNPSETTLEFVSFKMDLLTYFSDKARVLKEITAKTNTTSNQSTIIELYYLGDQLIDQIRKEHKDEDTKLFWRKDVLPFYEEAIEVCHKTNQIDKAFFFFEKSKAILLLEAMQSSDALAIVPDSIQQKIIYLQKALMQNKNKLSDTDKSTQENIHKELLSLQDRIDKTLDNIEQAYPKYFQVKYNLTIPTLADFQNTFLKNNGQTAIHYFYGNKHIYAFTSNQTKSAIYNLGETKEIENEIRTLLSYYQKSSSIENAPKVFLAQSKKVYDLLIKPLPLENATELILFPDGALAYLPFEALTTSEADDLSSATYLLQQFNVRYSYSATILAKQQEADQQQTNTGILAFAPFAKASSGYKYPTLNFSTDELGQISEKIDGIFLLNEKASKDYFINNQDQFSVIHLSTHAFSSPTERSPHIVFADTALYLSELYSMDIDANLVVLSACQTNIGKLYPGEGVMSLGRGFTYAGTKSLISSLWNVNATSTSLILSNFYDNLQNNFSKHTALHQAKKAYLENENIPSYERSPYYWAGMVYYGNDEQLVLNNKIKNSFSVKLLLCISLLFAALFFVKKTKSFAFKG